MTRKAVPVTAKSESTGSVINVAVDVGRSSVKIAAGGWHGQFPFLLATKKAATADYYAPGNHIQKWAEVDGETYFFGEEASLLGETIIQHTEGDAFRDTSMTVIVFSVAYAMFSLGKSFPSANVAINLTFDNHFQKEAYAKYLKGKHKVFFHREEAEFSFSIEKVFVLYQGFSGLLSLAMDDNFKIQKDYLEGEGVVIDVGRQTIDFLFLDRMVVRRGSSKDFGTFKVYEKVGELLKKKYSIVKEAYEIEEYLTRNKSINQLSSGEKIPIQPLVKEAVAYYFDDVMLHFSTFLSKETPDYLVLLGGGALIYGSFFKDKYKTVIIPDDPQFANAIGMHRFIAKASAK
jgi:hypothetical protein